MPTNWQHDMFGCCSNCKVLICTACCPCIVFGKTAEKVDESCLLHGLALYVPILNWICMAQIRTKIRETRSIEGSFGNDIVCSLCCGSCVLCQMAQEVGAMDMAQSMARE
jgi:Cys-rich protein (TIGR01571 family)